MSLKLKDEYVEADLQLGPMPNFNGSFERFFIEKAANLIFPKNSPSSSSSPTCSTSSFYETDDEYISTKESDDLNWMHNISLANNKLEQNLEIIYNDKNVYFKTLRPIYKNEDLLAFPSKDLEISLGLQFIPIRSDNSYQCRKCLKIFRFQYHLMLHSRYFCQLTTNNLMKSMLDNNTNNKTNNSTCLKHEKRKLNIDTFKTNLKKIKITDLNYSNESTTLSTQFNQANNKLVLNEKYYENLLTNFITNNDKFKDVNNFNLIKSIFERLNVYTHHLTQLSNDYNSKNFINPNLISNNYNQLQAVLNNNNNDSCNNNVNNITKSISPTTCNLIQIQQDEMCNKINETKLNKKSLHNHQTKNIKSNNSFEINQMINTQTMQNWCAKCNTHFRLTTDLVFHMRSFHRTNKKDDTDIVDLASSNSKFITRNNTTNINEKSNDSSLKSKYLKCEICHEVFKEKHHLSRHMTSHR